MAKRQKVKSEEIEREETRKEQRLRQREREQHRMLYIGLGVAVGLALVVLVIGLFNQFVLRPNRAVATVGDREIVARDFWKRTLLERENLTNMLAFYQLREQQFGNQGFFTNQINQIQGTLASPFTLGTQTLDQMVEESIIEREAASRGITVSDQEIDDALREEVANSLNRVTVPQATETAVAMADATATAVLWTPTPAPTIDVSSTVTATATPIPTLEPLPTAVVISDTGYTEGLAALTANLSQSANMSIDDYRNVVRLRILREKLAVEIGGEQVSDTEEEVKARHILISEIAPTATATAVPEGQPTPEPTLTPTPLPPGAPTPEPTPAPRSREEALALAAEVKQRLDAGEEFSALAAEYSNDSSNADQGGDLGWFGRGRMVPQFEEAAFSLPVGQISEPISTTFGFHLIQVEEKDPQRAKDEAQLTDERNQAFSTWLQEQVTAANVRRGDLTSNLPSELQ